MAETADDLSTPLGQETVARKTRRFRLPFTPMQALAVLLGLFLVAFFLRRVGGSAVFFAGIAAQTLVIVMYFSLDIGYLWYNLIGCAACVVLSLTLQAILPRRRAP